MFEKVKLNKEKILILTTIMMGSIGIGIIIPVLPFYLKSLGASDIMTTVLFSAFALCSFLSAPVLGALSDKFGRKPMLVISNISTFIGWVVFALGNSLPILFLGRIIDGLAAGNISIAQTYLVDLAKDEKERASNMGLMGAAFGIGFIVGPAIGAFLSVYSHRLPFIAVAIFALINTIGIMLFIPESNRNLQSHKKTEFNPLKPLMRAVKDKALVARYAFWFMFGTVNAIQQGVFALYLIYAYNFSSTTTGLFIMTSGILMVLNQAFLIRKFWLKRFSTRFLEKWPYLFGALAYLLIAFQNIYLIPIAMILMVFGQSLISVTTSARFASLGGENKKGEVLGVASSITSLSMVIGPILGGILFTRSVSLPFIVASILMVIIFFFMVLAHNKEKKLKLTTEAGLIE